MDPLAERLILEHGIAQLESEIALGDDTLDTLMRLATLKDCYTQVLKLLTEDRRTTTRNNQEQALDRYTKAKNTKALIPSPRQSSWLRTIITGLK